MSVNFSVDNRLSIHEFKTKLYALGQDVQGYEFHVVEDSRRPSEFSITLFPPMNNDNHDFADELVSNVKNILPDTSVEDIRDGFRVEENIGQKEIVIQFITTNLKGV